MRKQAGQAFILVLILLGIGALLVVPALRLTGTSLTSSQIVERQVKGLYAADAATEYILWKLAYDNLGAQFTVDGQSASFNFNVCDVPVGVTIVMRATEGTGGTTLATNDKIKPTKTVSHQYLPASVPDRREVDYLYTISLDYISDINEDNPKVYLDAIYDLPPGDFGAGAYEGPTELSLDGGVTWEVVPDPDWDHAKGYLKWPADYDKDTGAGAFSSHPEFLGIEDFEVREVKKLRFKMRGTLGNKQVHCNWVVLKMEDGINTLSGPQAPITVGNPDNPGECQNENQIAVTKKSNPEIIQPGVPTPVEYTISMTNLYDKTRFIEEITDYLPPGFEYVEFLDSEIVFIDEEGIEHWVEDIQILELDPLNPLDPDNPLNDISIIDVNGLVRPQLRWRTQKFPNNNDISIPAGYTLKLKFRALATGEVSGSYYNEVIVILKTSGISISGFEAAGVTTGEFGNNYSWLTGTVIVPAYDSSSEAEGITIDANMSLIPGGITITSWYVD